MKERRVPSGARTASQLGLASSTEYLIQGIAEPSAFVAPGYNNEMPEVFRAPVSLTPSEIKAVILYLESLAGDTTFKEIRLLPELLASYQPDKPQIQINGDVAKGRDLFFDLEGRRPVPRVIPGSTWMAKSRAAKSARI